MVDEPKWTEAGLKAIPVSGKREEFRDPKTPGLVLLMTAAGIKTFYFVYRAPPGGRIAPRKWFKLGRLGIDLGLTTARAEALARRGEVARGIDPQGERKTSRKPGITLNDLCDRFERDYIQAGKIAKSSAVTYTQILTRRIRPALGNLPLDSIGTAEVAAFLDGIEAPGQARMAYAVLSRMFNRGELWGLRKAGTNPTRGHDVPTGPHRQVRLNDAQLRAFGQALTDLPLVPQARGFFALLILTGMRSSELMGRKRYFIPPRTWDEFNREDRVLWLNYHKTVKRIGPRPIYLCRYAVSILEALPREGEFILAGWEGSAEAWKAIKQKAGLSGITIHDLRHTFSSVGEDLGFSEATRGALMGHSASTQTGRYTHKLSKDLAEAAETIGAHLVKLLGYDAAFKPSTKASKSDRS